MTTGYSTLDTRHQTLDTFPPMHRHLPNLLTVLRLILAFVFFLILNQYRYPAGPMWALWTAMVMFIVAALTDWLDGMLARRWKVESQFGRIMDPFCDKVLVLGALIYLAGPRFVDPVALAADEPPLGIVHGNMVSGVYPWMIALILARELLVTGIRGELEAKGVRFGASIWGKAKFITQSIIVPIVLFIIALDPKADGHEWMAVVRDLLIYATVIVSVISGAPYVTAAMRQMRGEKDEEDGTKA